MTPPRYRVLVAFTRTGAVFDELDGAEWDFSEPLAWGDIGSATIGLPLPGRDRTGRLVRASLRAVGQAMSACSIAIVENDQVLFAGPVTTLGWDASGVSIGASSLNWIFDRRMVMNPSYLNDPADPAADIALELQPRDAALELLELGMTGTRRGLPLTLPAQGGMAGDPILYKATDMRTVFETVKEATEVDGGPDILLLPALSADSSTISWTANLGAPDLGTANRDAVWDYPLVAINGDMDDSETVDHGYVLGDSFGEGEDERRYIGTTSIDRGEPWPALERADRTSTSEARPDRLAALAASYGQEYKLAVEEVGLSGPSDAGPRYRRDWNLGDVATFVITGHPWLDDQEVTRRIVEVSMGPDETVLTTTGGRLTVGGTA